MESNIIQSNTLYNNFMIYTSKLIVIYQGTIPTWAFNPLPLKGRLSQAKPAPKCPVSCD